MSAVARGADHKIVEHEITGHEITGHEITEDVPHRELVQLSAQFAHAFLRWLDGSPDALTYPRLRMLESLHCQGPAKMRDLAERLAMSARNLTTLADGLKAEGLVRRVAHPTDRRATLLELTPDGMAAAECSLAPRMAEISCLFDALSPAEHDGLRHTLTTLIDRMDADASPYPGE